MSGPAGAAKHRKHSWPLMARSGILGTAASGFRAWIASRWTMLLSGTKAAAGAMVTIVVNDWMTLGKKM